MEFKTIIFWLLLTAFIIPNLIFGYQKLVGQKQKTEQFNRFGYPLWFMRILGLAELLVCLSLLFSQTRNWGIIVFSIILAGAVYTHLKQKDTLKDVMVPVFVASHLLIIFLVAFWL